MLRRFASGDLTKIRSGPESRETEGDVWLIRASPFQLQLLSSYLQGPMSEFRQGRWPSRLTVDAELTVDNSPAKGPAMDLGWAVVNSECSDITEYALDHGVASQSEATEYLH